MAVGSGLFPNGPRSKGGAVVTCVTVTQARPRGRGNNVPAELWFLTAFTTNSKYCRAPLTTNLSISTVNKTLHFHFHFHFHLSPSPWPRLFPSPAAPSHVPWPARRDQPVVPATATLEKFKWERRPDVRRFGAPNVSSRVSSIPVAAGGLKLAGII